MSSRRVLKAAEAIREVVSMAILTDLQRSADRRRDGDARRGFARHAAGEGARFDHGRANGAAEAVSARLAKLGRLFAEQDRRPDRYAVHAASYGLSWIGREKIAGHRQMLDEVLPDTKPSPESADDELDAADRSLTKINRFRQRECNGTTRRNIDAARSSPTYNSQLISELNGHTESCRTDQQSAEGGQEALQARRAAEGSLAARASAVRLLPGGFAARGGRAGVSVAEDTTISAGTKCA